jgi:hypothetical protein
MTMIYNTMPPIQNKTNLYLHSTQNKIKLGSSYNKSKLKKELEQYQKNFNKLSSLLGTSINKSKCVPLL